MLSRWWAIEKKEPAPLAMVVQHFSADQSFSRNRQCSASAFSVVYNIKQYCYLPFHLHIYVYTIVSPIAKKERTLLLSLCSILLYIPTCIHDWAALFFLFLRYWQFVLVLYVLQLQEGTNGIQVRGTSRETNTKEFVMKAVKPHQRRLELAGGTHLESQGVAKFVTVVMSCV